jgi:RNA polymerase primary sigma factor
MRQLKITKQITHRNEEAINRYFQDISKFPMITAEEEVELSVRIHKGDEIALEKLVASNLRFVISVAKQYQNKGLAFSDLINEGNVGLVKAAKRFDEKKGFKFISYAVWWIRQSITQAISEQTRVVRLPLNRVSSISKIVRAIPYLEQEYEREPTETEIAGYLKVDNEKVKVANRMKNKQISFDNPLKNNNNDDDASLYDVIQTDNIASPDENLMQESLVINLQRALSKLSQRESDILTMSFGLGNTPAHSLHYIAAKFDMSSERIRQIRRAAILKLKKLLQGRGDFLEQ